MEEPNFIAGRECLDFTTVVDAIIRRSCIVDYGIIQRIKADGVVDVAVAVSSTPQNMFCMTCILANVASSAVAIDIKPVVGDRVLVLYPRIYDSTMFSMAESEADRKKIIVNENAKGYNLCGGIAILINQCKTFYKNVITAEAGKIDIALAYDTDEEKNKFTLSVNEKGEFTLHSNDVSVSADKDGAFTLVTKKTTVNYDKDGAITVTAPKASISIDKDGNVVIDSKGMYTIKNDKTDLFKVIKGLSDEVSNLTTEGSSSAQATSATSKLSIETWVTGTLSKLLTDTTEPPAP